ncbi:MAG: hypothetical protein IH991_02335, partial [Planctomycetes bacterium]|nr:hypothetical protein [Planctomycetota bacterium]
MPGDWMESYELPFQISLEDADRISRENEAELFRAMNLLKSRADQLRGQLSPQSPSLALMDQVDALLARAQQIRNYLVRMFMNLVPMIAKRLSNPRYTLDELSSEGYVTILRAVEKFDVGRGYRFSTYASHALRRNLYRFVVKGRKQQQRECVAEGMDNVMDRHKWTWDFQKRMESTVANLTKCIGRLSDRDQSIVQARFGLGQWQQP